VRRRLAALRESVPPSDGKFSFQVADVGPATDWYGDPKPLGQWVIATMAVTNTGNEPQSFFAQNQKLIDTSGLGVRG
jgi:hypothetical protein